MAERQSVRLVFGEMLQGVRNQFRHRPQYSKPRPFVQNSIGHLSCSFSHFLLYIKTPKGN